MSGMAGGGSTVHFSPEQVDPELCTSQWCHLGSVVSTEMVIFAAILVGLVLFGTLFIIRSAEDRCREERRRTRDEAKAFQRFADRVSSLTPAQSIELTSTPSTLVEPPDGEDLRTIEDTYKKTVMAVDHYDEEYGESYLASIRGEFGDDAATALEANDQLTSLIQKTLVTKSRQAAREREALASAVTVELDELSTYRRRLDELERKRERAMANIDKPHFKTGFEYTRDTWDELYRLEDEVETIAADRQASLQDSPLTMRLGSHDFYEYLYAPLEEATFPVLAQTVKLIEQIQSDRHTVEQRLAQVS